jgi:negative regulator of replication initiation
MANRVKSTLDKIKDIEKELRSIIKSGDYDKEKRLYILSQFEVLKYLYEIEKAADGSKDDFKISIEYSN